MTSSTSQKSGAYLRPTPYQREGSRTPPHCWWNAVLLLFSSSLRTQNAGLLPVFFLFLSKVLRLLRIFCALLCRHRVRSTSFITSGCSFRHNSRQLGEIRHGPYSRPSFFTSILQWNSITSDRFPTSSCACAVRYLQNKISNSLTLYLISDYAMCHHI